MWAIDSITEWRPTQGAWATWPKFLVNSGLKIYRNDLMYIQLTFTGIYDKSISEPKYKTLESGGQLRIHLSTPNFYSLSNQLLILSSQPFPFNAFGVVSNRRMGYFSNIALGNYKVSHFLVYMLSACFPKCICEGYLFYFKIGQIDSNKLIIKVIRQDIRELFHYVHVYVCLCEDQRTTLAFETASLINLGFTPQAKWTSQ